MQESRATGRSYFLESLDGREELGASYDADADVLYLWRANGPVEAVTLPTDDGLLIRIHPETGDLVGITLMDFEACWADKERVEFSIPAVGSSERAAASQKREAEHRELVLA